MVHICNPSTEETKAGGLWGQGQPGLQRDPVLKNEIHIFKRWLNRWGTAGSCL
jgi:hypothetical protein